MAKSTVKRIRGYQMEYLSNLHPDFSKALDLLIARDKAYKLFSLAEVRRIMREELERMGGCRFGKKHRERQDIREDSCKPAD